MFRLPALVLTGVAALVLFAQPAAAQPPGDYGAPSTYPVYPIGINPSKASTQQQQRLYRYVPAVGAAVTAPLPPRPVAAPLATETAVIVAVSEPAAGPMLVDLKGPNGAVRSFRVVGGHDAIRVRNFVIHPGESLTLNFQTPGRQTRSVVQ